MPRLASALTLTLPPPEKGTTAQRWLYQALRAEILAGRLRPGARLPGTRELASQQRLSRGTVVAAFEQLKSEGYVEGSVGSGTHVSRVLPDDLLQVPQKPRTSAPARSTPDRRLSRFARRARAFSMLEARPSTAFRPNLPALDLFPTTLWAQVTSQRLRRASTSLFLGCDALGYRPLREAVADYVAASRGVRCSADQVTILSGVQEALDLVTRLVVDPGDRVCMEDPGYTGAALTFEAAGAWLATADVDAEGLNPRHPGLRGARLVYVTPAHQFPLGVAMSLRRRLELLEWAQEAGALIFEDDYDSEYRYTGRPLPALQGLDQAELVLFAGSFNKVLFPSLRLGYLVVPSDLVDPVAAVQSTSHRHAPLLQQAVLCDFITQGHFGRHLRRMREVYAERLSVLLEGARRELSGLLELSGVEAGLQTAGWLCGGRDGESAALAAAARGVEVTPLSRYYRRPPEREGLQLGFAAVDTDELARGVRELAAALEGVARRPSPALRAAASPPDGRAPASRRRPGRSSRRTPAARRGR